MAGPKSNLSQGWKSIADVIEIDAPEPFGRYFGCEHRVEENIKLSKEDHPFHHIFSTVKTAAVAHQHRTNDFWEHDKANKTWTRYHIYPRKRRWIPRDCYDEVPTAKFEHARWTYVDGVDEPILDDWVKSGDIDQGGWWTGKTVFTYQDDGDDDGDHEIYSLAAKKKNGGAHRVKSIAKKKAKQQRFRSIEDITVPKNECMSKSVNMVYYDMKNFLESCVEAYCTLAKVDKSSLKRVSTPFIDLKIAKPVESEKEPVGRLQPIASKVLMKILFAARMARYDLLRATQALASRVTKWSRECDDALHRLVSYINCSLTSTMRGYIGDKFSECQLWLFADADFAGAHDSKSTTGSFMALVGPNTYFPINAFSKKQTAVAMSSTEAEVIAANHSVRAQGLPSLSLFNYLLAMSDPDTALEERQKQAGLQAMPKATSPKDPVSIARIDPELDEIRYGFFHNGPESVANVNHLQVHLGKSFTVQFMEDNQATITILTTGESQSMRHTDRTQRVSFGWLQQQFQGDQFDLVNVNTSYQVADLLTKPFTSPAKWQHAIDLLGLVDYEYTPPTKPTLVASPRGEGDSCYDRIMIEYCCSENSKLGEENRKHAKGCKVIRVTKDDDATRGECITKTVKKVEEFMKSNPKEKTDLMIYISLPCTGGCPWNNVNKESPNGRERIKEHRKLFKKLFKGLEDLCHRLSYATPILLFELPTMCEYWKWKRVQAFLSKYGMDKYKFDGCQLGTCDKHGNLIRKQWTLASNLVAYSAFTAFKCDGSHQHGESRGNDLRKAENYTYKVTDMIHKIFKEYAHDKHSTRGTQYACPTINCTSLTAQHPETITMARRNVPALVQPVPQKALLNYWHEEIVNLAYHLVKSQVIQDQHTEQLIEGLLSQYTPQSVLSCWVQGECWQDTVLSKLAQLSDTGLAKLGTGDASMSKICWVVVSDSGLVAISGGRKNRMKYEMHDEFQKKKPASVEKLVYRPLWGKTLRPLAYEVRSAIQELHAEFGRDVQIHVVVYWSGNELVGPTGVEDEPDWPHRPSNLSTKEVYDGLEQSIRILAGICREAESAVLLSCPKADLYGFGPVWDHTFKFVNEAATQRGLKVVECTIMVDALELGDRYHMKKTPANIEVATTFITNILHLLQAVHEHTPTVTAIDYLVNSGHVLGPTAAIEVTNTATNEVFAAFKRRVIDEYAKKVITSLGASTRFTSEEINDQNPVQGEVTEELKAALITQVPIAQAEGATVIDVEAIGETEEEESRKRARVDEPPSSSTSTFVAPTPKIATPQVKSAPAPAAPLTSTSSTAPHAEDAAAVPTVGNLATPPIVTEATEMCYQKPACRDLPEHVVKTFAGGTRLALITFENDEEVERPLVPAKGSDYHGYISPHWQLHCSQRSTSCTASQVC